MLNKILSELKVVIDHTDNNWANAKLFNCYSELEKYAEKSFPLDKPVKHATNAKQLNKALDDLITNCLEKGAGSMCIDPMQPVYAENIEKLKKIISDSWLSV